MGSLGYAAATIGLVLALRNLSQQGMFLVGGSAADRIGCRPMIILGCALRIVAFGLFVVVDDLPGLIAAAVLTGLAGAFFNPAVRAYLMHEAGDRRAECSRCSTSSGTSAHWPARCSAPRCSPWTSGWSVRARGRRLLRAVQPALPGTAGRGPAGVRGRGAVSAVFVVSTLVGIAGQVGSPRGAGPAGRGRAMAVGLLLMGAGFVPIGVAARSSPPHPPSGPPPGCSPSHPCWSAPWCSPWGSR